MTQVYVYIVLMVPASEAMNIYKDCLGGELTIQTVGESPMANQCPAAIHFLKII